MDILRAICEYYSKGCCSVYKTKVNKSSKDAEYCDAFENFEDSYEKRLIEEEDWED